MTATLVVETVTGPRMADLRRARDCAAGDLVELRLDGVTDLDVAGALDGRKRPVIVTCRPAWEGGAFSGSEAERMRVLGDAIRLGAEYVDLEWKADRRHLPHGERTQIVLSHHDFDGIPGDLADRVRAMRAEQPRVVKVAAAAARLSDCLTLREVMTGSSSHVAIAMGAAGQITRFCPWLFGSCWTYGGAAASGQIAACELIDRYRVRQTTAATKIYALAGAPLGHSASPAMHNSAIAALGLDAVYVPLESADAAEFRRVADAIGVAGASVTAPLKQTLLGDDVTSDEMVGWIGALNTLKRGDRGWQGRNFDVAGFLTPLDRRSSKLRGARAVVLGAGGAARAAVWALKTHGARVEVAARRPDEATRLAQEFRVGVAPWPPAPGWDVLINATPVGTWPNLDQSPLDRASLQGGLVYDLVYNPLETELMKQARAAGIETIGGLEMLVAQACRQLDWWTGHDAPTAAVERGALEFLGGQRR
ncbi:MAG TPA: type I 3-dehydroquinate dehydratase [Vicinamibacterales bacterium]|nr:type I 3-dehydroquinate dehydratase [Vicinamibacterales bacterium]